MKFKPAREPQEVTPREFDPEVYRVDYPTHAELLGAVPARNRRDMVGVPVFEKQDMIAWMLEGISRNFEPDATRVVFYFDGCRDRSLAMFESLVWHYLTLRNFPATAIVGPEPVYEGPSHNVLLREFLNTNSEYLYVPQDDQTFNGPIVHRVLDIAARHDGRLGVIGGRDGYDTYNGEKASGTQREWPGGPPVNTPSSVTLLDGQWVSRKFVNTGPVVYNRRLVEAIGVFDPRFRNYYHIEDYCYRALMAGFENVVVGMPVLHAKFGRYGVSRVYDPGFSDADLALIRQKVPNHP